MAIIQKRGILMNECIFKEKLAKAINKKTILITGASSGIGERLAYYLQDFDVNLILVARREEKLLEIKKAIEKNVARVFVYSIDLREQNKVAILIKDIINKNGGIDYFVNNAGKSIMRSIDDSLNRFHDFQRTMAINYFAPVQLMLALVPVLKKNIGQVINISTINVLITPFPYWAAYMFQICFDKWFCSASKS